MLNPRICPGCFQANEFDRSHCWKCMKSLEIAPTPGDYVRFFGLRGRWDKQDVKAAYLRLAKKYHPDANTGDREADAFFKFVNAGSEVLMPLDGEQVARQEHLVAGKDPDVPVDPSSGIANMELYEKLLSVVRDARAHNAPKPPPSSPLKKLTNWLNQLFSSKS